MPRVDIYYHFLPPDDVVSAVTLATWQRGCRSEVGPFVYSVPTARAEPLRLHFQYPSLLMGYLTTVFGDPIGPKIVPMAVLATPCGWLPHGRCGHFGKPPRRIL